MLDALHDELYNLCCDAGIASRLPPLVPDQILKLKKLTVLTLAETNKVSYLEMLNGLFFKKLTQTSLRVLTYHLFDHGLHLCYALMSAS